MSYRKNNTPFFQIETTGANFHSCGLGGEIASGGKATLEGSEKECVVTFTSTANGIEVKPSGFECQYYCGARASFDGIYLKPAAGCDSRSMKKTRSLFKKLYDKKKYQQAFTKLNTLYTTCRKTLGWLETGWIQNDLAVTQYKMGDTKGCNATLASFTEDVKKPDEVILQDHAPSDAEAWLPIVKAARHNLELCNKITNKG